MSVKFDYWYSRHFVILALGVGVCICVITPFFFVGKSRMVGKTTSSDRRSGVRVSVLKYSHYEGNRVDLMLKENSNEVIDFANSVVNVAYLHANIEVESISLSQVARLKFPELKFAYIRTLRSSENLIETLLSSSPDLREVFLDGPFEDDDLKYLTTIQSLRKITLKRTAISDISGKYLADAGTIQSLTIDRANVTDGFIEHLSEFQQLAYLSITRTQISPDAVLHLEELKQLNYLELDCRLKDIHATSFLRYHKLRYLVLRNADLSEKSMDVFRRSKTLSYVSLHNCGVPDAEISIDSDLEERPMNDVDLRD